MIMQSLVLLLVLTLLLLVVVILGLFYFRSVVKDNSNKQDEILKRNAEKAKRTQWFRAHYASDKRFKLWRKIFVWEASGILFVDDKGVSFHYMSDADSESVIRFDPDRFELSWIGVKYLPNGGMPWFCLTANNEKHYFTADSGMTIVNALRLTTDIYNQIKLVFPGLEVNGNMRPEAGFALEKNRFSLVTMVLIFLLGLYALIDYMLNLEVFVVEPDLAGIVLLSILTIVLSYLVLKKGEIPVTERLGLAVLLGITFGLATPPALLRLNQLTDNDGLRTYQYRLNSKLELVPAEILANDLPVLYFPNNKEYWGHFDDNSQHEISLRKGGLGFYQVNMRPVYRDMRAYYQEKYKAERIKRSNKTESTK